MDQITEQYSQSAQKQLQHIEAVTGAFRQQCEALKNKTEQEINALDKAQPQAQDQENRLKLKLKRDLKQVLGEYEKELHRSFGIGLVELENIYRKKEIQRLQQIEQEILAM